MSRLQKLTLLLLSAATGLLAVALAGSPAAGDSTGKAAKTKTVAVRDNFFSPSSITVRRGGRVTWVWHGQNDHTVTFTKVPSGASKKSARRARASGSFTRSFGKRGTYRYVCTIHSVLGMRGVVHVR
jgi:plastocyanin